MSKFKKGTNTLVRCKICGKLTHSSNEGYQGIELCKKCLRECEEENKRADTPKETP